MDTEIIESESSIIARVEASGHKSVTHKKLKRLYDGDLFLPSKQIHKEGKPGSETYYPRGTGDRVIAIYEISQGKRRSSKYIGWHLWWRGFEVPEKYWKLPLQKIAHWYDLESPQIKKLLKPHPLGDTVITKSGFRLIQNLHEAKTRIKNSVFLQMRKRMNFNYWGTFMRFVLEIQTGQYRGWNKEFNISDHELRERKSLGIKIDRQIFDLREDKTILDKGLGLHTARTHHQPGQKPWLEGDIDEPIAELANVLKGLQLADFFKTISNFEIEQARDEMRHIFSNSLHNVNSNRKKFGKYAFGFGVMAQLADEQQKVRDRGLLLLLWLALRRAPGMGEKLNPSIRPLPKP